MAQHEYLVIIENAGSNWSGYAPDLPAVLGVGASPEECEQNLREGIRDYLAFCASEHLEVPKPSTRAAYVKVAA